MTPHVGAAQAPCETPPPRRAPAAAARWWFDGARDAPPPVRGASLLAQRHWRALRAPAQAPAPLDGWWATLATMAPAQLVAAAALFDVMALVQAPRIDQRWPQLMHSAGARWAASVAAIQPFQRLMHWPADGADDGSAGPVRGMLELQPRLNAHCPGLWQRCLQGWPSPLLESLLSRDTPPALPGTEPEPSARRALRCWQQCVARAGGPA